jgi:transposase-like protein
MGRKGYPAEFRRRALDLVAAGKTVAEVARLLEVSDQSIYTWRRQEQIDRGELPGLSSAEREELRAARLRIRALETELAVHRRATELLKESVRPKALRGDRRDRERGAAGRGRLPSTRRLERRILRLA